MMIDLRRETLICKQKDDLRRMNLETENMSGEKSSLLCAPILSFGNVFFFCGPGMLWSHFGTKVGDRELKGVVGCCTNQDQEKLRS